MRGVRDEYRRLWRRHRLHHLQEDDPMTAAVFALALAALFIVCAIDCRRSARRAETAAANAEWFADSADISCQHTRHAANINAKWSKS